MIGDPSGKSQERNLLSAEQIDANVAGVRAQLERFLDFNTAPNAAKIVNNADWLGTIDVLSFLRDVGKHFSVGYMLQKESVSRRMESADGISYTEFSYLVLQAYDFLQLFDRHGCTLQMGGSDQWGNITAGIELIRKVRGKKAHGLVWPLMKTAAGTKFGKTEAGTIWLDPALTSQYRFYQFWLNTDDRDVVNYLKVFTWLDRATIDALERAVADAPAARDAQRTLAREVTSMVHGPEGLALAERETAAQFGGGDDADIPAHRDGRVGIRRRHAAYRLHGGDHACALEERGREDDQAGRVLLERHPRHRRARQGHDGGCGRGAASRREKGNANGELSRQLIASVRRGLRERADWRDRQSYTVPSSSIARPADWP